MRAVKKLQFRMVRVPYTENLGPIRRTHREIQSVSILNQLLDYQKTLGGYLVPTSEATLLRILIAYML